MSQLTIVAHIFAKPDQTAFVRSELVKLIDVTRAEAGCINYDLHQDNDNPSHFMFYENWESHALWLAHMNSQHLTDYAKAVDGAVDRFDVFQMTPQV